MLGVAKITSSFGETGASAERRRGCVNRLRLCKSSTDATVLGSFLTATTLKTEGRRMEGRREGREREVAGSTLLRLWADEEVYEYHISGRRRSVPRDMNMRTRTETQRAATMVSDQSWPRNQNNKMNPPIRV